MKFYITDGLHKIYIGLSEIGSYFHFNKPLTTVWYDCAGSVGKYLSAAPYEEEYRNEVRNRIQDNLHQDFTGREEVLYELLRPLLKLFPNGEYELKYYPGEGSAFFEYLKEWYLLISDPANLQQQQESLSTSTSGFYDGYSQCFIATEPKSRIDEERVRYFEASIQRGERPSAIIVNSSFNNGDLTSEHFVLDGHHKLTAYKNLNIYPAIVEITHLPGMRTELEFNAEQLIEVLPRYETEHLLKNWDEKEKYLLPYLKNPESKLHLFIKNGDYKSYHKNGRLKHEAFYINDKIEGIGHWWFENGQLEKTEEYKNGIRQGSWKQWYPSGKMMYIQPFNEKGQYDGHLISYYENGNVRWEQIQKDGKNIDGYSYLSWFEDGKKEAELKYLNGIMIERKNYSREGALVNFEERDAMTGRLVKRK